MVGDDLVGQRWPLVHQSAGVGGVFWVEQRPGQRHHLVGAQALVSVTAGGHLLGGGGLGGGARYQRGGGPPRDPSG